MYPIKKEKKNEKHKKEKCRGCSPQHFFRLYEYSIPTNNINIYRVIS